MKKPKKLKKNDKVAVIAPSSPIDENKIKQAVSFLEKLELNIIIKSCCYNKISYLSGSDFLRAKNINESFSDKNIKGIFCIRGGYGAQRLLELLDYKTIFKNPKIFSGYSDITALHIFLNQKCNLITYHSPMIGTTLLRNDLDEHTKDSFIDSIFENEKIINKNKFYSYELYALVRGNAKGTLIGGNLSVITTSIGTPYEINTKNKILFIEEINEDLYKIDRMLTQLKLSKKLESCAGIVFGQFIKCNQEDNKYDIKSILNDIVKPINIPSLLNLNCGHGLPNITLEMGSKYEINGNKLILGDV
ncbi:MAG: LD-carboxypeptidase [Clostridiales bacterium]|nr:LD-carboxypeptidase [Clostridiales bacterium]